MLRLPPLERYRCDVTWSPYRFLGQVIRDQAVLAYSLSYPDATDPFFGYAKKRISATTRTPSNAIMLLLAVLLRLGVCW